MRFWVSSAEVNKRNIVYGRCERRNKYHTQAKNNNKKERKQEIKDVKVDIFFKKDLIEKHKKVISNVEVQRIEKERTPIMNTKLSQVNSTKRDIKKTLI